MKNVKIKSKNLLKGALLMGLFIGAGLFAMNVDNLVSYADQGSVKADNSNGAIAYVATFDDKCGGSKAKKDDSKAKEGDSKAKEGKCGEGKCGDDKKAKEGKCGDGDAKAGKEGKEGKCGEGKCGDDGKAKSGDKAKKESKCGEGKCGV